MIESIFNEDPNPTLSERDGEASGNTNQTKSESDSQDEKIEPQILTVILLF